LSSTVVMVVVVVVVVMCKRVWHGWSISRAWQTQQVGQILPALLHAHCSHKWHAALEYITWVSLLLCYHTLQTSMPHGFKSSTHPIHSLHQVTSQHFWHTSFSTVTLGLHTFSSSAKTSTRILTDFLEIYVCALWPNHKLHVQTGHKDKSSRVEVIVYIHQNADFKTHLFTVQKHSIIVGNIHSTLLDTTTVKTVTTLHVWLNQSIS
jgi:hypothetical protein